MTFQSQRCPLPRQQHDRVMALLSFGIDPGSTCSYCKKPRHTKVKIRKLKKRRNSNKRNAGQTTKKEFPKWPTCDKTNHTAEQCWKVAGVHLKPKNFKLQETNTNDTSTSHDEPANRQITSIPKKPKNQIRRDCK